ncbi:hypothetical protein P7K49_029537 [Saguinus oedipus]|uniref:Uncharacterized protein n=1 Tax=Saguinus oedipus TaxID=9490 RepID=A0ABQ9U8Q0_SAGOE|nr:hypothetical protein P7K49_029537 [Saguinus oedipus]
MALDPSALVPPVVGNFPTPPAALRGEKRQAPPLNLVVTTESSEPARREANSPCRPKASSSHGDWKADCDATRPVVGDKCDNPVPVLRARLEPTPIQVLLPNLPLRAKAGGGEPAGRKRAGAPCRPAPEGQPGRHCRARYPRWPPPGPPARTHTAARQLRGTRKRSVLFSNASFSRRGAAGWERKTGERAVERGAERGGAAGVTPSPTPSRPFAGPRWAVPACASGRAPSSWPACSDVQKAALPLHRGSDRRRAPGWVGPGWAGPGRAGLGRLTPGERAPEEPFPLQSRG